uniref:Uncharacterized protein n=1 Tax=Anopheles melas TaxID=34690 RepID=A0A182U6M3_9DIPT
MWKLVTLLAVLFAFEASFAKAWDAHRLVRYRHRFAKCRLPAGTGSVVVVLVVLLLPMGTDPADDENAHNPQGSTFMLPVPGRFSNPHPLHTVRLLSGSGCDAAPGTGPPCLPDATTNSGSM